MKKVSVIIPIYNVQDYIEECLVSVLNQTLQEIEIICVDDGTPDDSMRIVEPYVMKDDRIVVLHKENGGLSSARNAGLKIAQGEYVYFLDSDDYLKNDTLEILYNYANDNHLDNIYFGAEVFFENEDVKEKNSQFLTFYDKTKEYTGVYSGQDLFAEMEANSDFKTSACLQMVKREFLQKNGIDFYVGILHEDNLFSLQVVSAAQRVMCIPDKLYMRRVREGSIMTDVQACRNSFGYFVTMKEYLLFAENIQMSTEFKEAILTRMKAMYNNVINKIANVSEEKIWDSIREESDVTQLQYLLFAKYVADINDKNRRLKRRLRIKKREIRKVKNSYSYKAGLLITYFPRKIGKIIKKIVKAIIRR